jgi:Tfp pilus assembly protein PilO
VSAVRARRPLWRRLAPVVVGLLALNALVFAAYTVPRGLQVRNATARAAEARKSLDEARQATAALRRQAETIRSNATDTQRFYQDLVVGGRAELLPLLEDIDRMATEPGLKPSARTYNLEEVKGADLTRVRVQLAVQGSYEQLLGFLDRVERSERFLTIDRVDLNAGGAEGPSLRVEVSAYVRGRPPAEPRERRRG